MPPAIRLSHIGSAVSAVTHDLLISDRKKKKKLFNDTQLVVPTAGPTSDGNTLSCHAARGGMQVGAFLDAKLLQKIRKKKTKMPNEEGMS